jgi:sulfite reductase (NADPH) flavoprotein alpha-component
MNRYFAGALVVLGYVVFCVGVAVLQRRRRMQTVGGASGPEVLLVAYASQTGFAEIIARRTAQALEDAGVPVRLAALAELGGAALQQFRRALFVVSTTGEGDAPDSVATFRRTLAGHLALNELAYGVLALGDRSYRRFCAFGLALDAWLHAQGARPLFDTVLVDDGDEGALRHWQHYLTVLGASAGMPDWAAPDYQPWRLAQRHLLNNGSPGAPVYRIVLEPEGRAVAQAEWRAGDLVEVGPRDEAGELLAHREYSIASLPEDGGLELVVRQMRHPDGTPGLGSGWLTERAQPGALIDLRIRVNGGFHPPAAETPLILIGNGTGIAGLRAHLKARAAIGAGRNWLLFGERTRAHDALFADEIQAWSAQGMLARVDLAYSRDAGAPRYVQDCLSAAEGALLDWVGQGAAIYVCGSLEGMAGGVAEVLERVLGRERVDDLVAAGRLRRDVY